MCSVTATVKKEGSNTIISSIIAYVMANAIKTTSIINVDVKTTRRIYCSHPPHLIFFFEILGVCI